MTSDLSAESVHYFAGPQHAAGDGMRTSLVASAETPCGLELWAARECRDEAEDALGERFDVTVDAKRVTCKACKKVMRTQNRELDH